MVRGKEQLLMTPGCSVDTAGRLELLFAEMGRQLMEKVWGRVETGYLKLDMLSLGGLSDTPVAL